MRLKNNIHNLTEYTIAQLAYLAGIIDGEGCIYIGNFSSNKKTGTKNYQTMMEVTNTEKGLIDWLFNNFGGRVSMYTAKQTPANSRKPVYRWIVSGELLTHLCPRILPYLTIKIRQCEIMIEMRKTFLGTGAKKGTQGSATVPKDILDIRQSFFNEMRSLHCRNYADK